MIVIDQNDWHRNTSGRPPQALAVIFIDVHGGKVGSHVSKARLSPEPRVCVQHSSASPTMTIDSSYVGRYGTLSLMKKDGSNIPIAHYPIDDDEITIGRDPNCSVRLYYDTISRLHCKVTFEDAKVRARSIVSWHSAQTISGILDRLRNIWSRGGRFSSFPDRYRSNNRTTWQ